MNAHAVFTRATIITFVAMALAGCSTVANVESEGVIAVVAAQATGLQERAEGELVVASGGCLALDTDEQLMLLAWPPGVSLASVEGSSVVTVAQTGDRFTVGEVVSIAGGLQASAVEPVVSIPEQCGEFTAVYLVNGLD